MSRAAFLRFVVPSLLLMLGVLLLPLVLTLDLSVRSCAVALQSRSFVIGGPFGTVTQDMMAAQTGTDGAPRKVCLFVGLAHYRDLLETPQLVQAVASGAWSDLDRLPFWSALAFTLLYVAITTPVVVGGGLVLALALARCTRALRGAVLSASLLPFVVTPVVGALAVKWLFREHALVPTLLAQFGVQVFWMADAASARALVIFYGIWQTLPFALVVLYAGLLSVPVETMEAARVDGATRLQRLRHVTLPHLQPLLLFITLIHVMDAYRVFEPVLVLTRGAFARSVQYLTYSILIEQGDPHRAAAAAVLTIIGVAVLIAPLLARLYREQRLGQ